MADTLAGLSIRAVDTPRRVAAVAALAREIWTEHYVPIIGPEQVSYMLDEIQSGAFAHEWLGQAREGAPYLLERREFDHDLPIERVGRQLRALMPFIEAKSVR